MLFLLPSLCISIFSILILLNNSSCSSSFLFFCKFLIPNTIKNNPSKIRTNITAKFQMLAKHTKIIASVCNTNNIILSLLLKKSCKNFFISYIPKNFKIIKVSCRRLHYHLTYINFSYYTSQPPTLLVVTFVTSVHFVDTGSSTIVVVSYQGVLQTTLYETPRLS